MKKQTPKGMLVCGSFRRAGMTFYLRHGQMVARVSRSMERRSCTLAQFEHRQKMRHTIALWQTLRLCRPMFTQHKTTYLGFASMANRLPAVYVPQGLSDAMLLMPGIPVSDGTLPEVRQWLGDNALMTALKAGESSKEEERLWLYTAEQRVLEGTPRVIFGVREVSRGEMTEVDGCLALTGDEFADGMKGWALVRTVGDRCSPQGLVTRCTYYERFTTEEALQAAADSYGGLT